MRRSILTAFDGWLGGLITVAAFGIAVASYDLASKANRIALQAAEDAMAQAQISNEIAFLVLCLAQTGDSLYDGTCATFKGMVSLAGIASKIASPLVTIPTTTNLPIDPLTPVSHGRSSITIGVCIGVGCLTVGVITGMCCFSGDKQKHQKQEEDEYPEDFYLQGDE